MTLEAARILASLEEHVIIPRGVTQFLSQIRDTFQPSPVRTKRESIDGQTESHLTSSTTLLQIPSWRELSLTTGVLPSSTHVAITPI